MLMQRIPSLLALCAAVVTSYALQFPRSRAHREAAPMSMPEGPGLSASYPRDRGIGRDPHVLFTENFETGTLEQIGNRWGSIRNDGGNVLAFSRDVPPHSAGRRSLQMTATLGENTGGHLYT